MKEKYIRANNAPFMNKKINKYIMNRSRLRNKLLKTPNATNKYNYKRQRSYIVNLLRRENRLTTKALILIKLRTVRNSGKQ